MRTMKAALVLFGGVAVWIAGAGCGPRCDSGGNPEDLVLLRPGQSLNGLPTCQPTTFACDAGRTCARVNLGSCATEPLCLTEQDRGRLTCPEGRTLATLESQPPEIVCASP